MASYRNSSFPPNGAWDRRLSEIVCHELQPVTTVHENDWFSVRNRGGYFTLENRLRTVVVLPVVDNNSIVMVRAKRPVIADVTLELPAGAIEENEDPQVGAARELVEETGIQILQPERFIAMPPLAVSPNRSPMLSYVFRVDVSHREFGERGPSDNEIHSVLRVAIRDLPKMMANGEIYVSVPLAVLGIFLLTAER
jgi:8-oxo-dGTP pyrophosphatase MutT (NUDIX family)